MALITLLDAQLAFGHVPLLGPGRDAERLEALDGWNWEQRVDRNAAAPAPGPRRHGRHAVGRHQEARGAGAGPGGQPDVLLLDEPTNHLDLDAIEWLQDLLVDFKGSVVLISHDRAFIDAWPRASSSWTAAAAQLPRQLQPPTWPPRRAAGATKPSSTPAPTSCWRRRRSGSARAWKPGARAAWPHRAPGELRAQQRRGATLLGSVRLELAAGLPRQDRGRADRGRASASATARLVDGLQRHHPARRQGRPDRPQRRGQDHAAQAHPGRAAAHLGSVRQGTRLQVAYFDQMRNALDLDATLADTISPGSEWIEIGNARAST
jgi:ATP-binding cassette subfamily F protein uup